MEEESTDNAKKFGILSAESEVRAQSKIQFPYSDLETGIEVVRVIHEKIGGVWCSPDQLAAAMGQTPRSGNFRLKVSTARIFGLIETSPGRIDITELGFEIIDAGREKVAKYKAFFNVELFRKVYEDYKGKQLPPRTAAFELMLERAGVAPKQKANARRALDSSAEQAGFYLHGRERLVAPNLDIEDIGGHYEDERDSSVREEEREKGAEDDSGIGLDPLIAGLLSRLPEPEKGWPMNKRVRWLQAMAINLSLIYGEDGEINITGSPDRSRASFERDSHD